MVRAEQKAINEILHLEAQRMHALDLKADLISGEIDIVKREREVRFRSTDVGTDGSNG